MVTADKDCFFAGLRFLGTAGAVLVPRAHIGYLNLCKARVHVHLQLLYLTRRAAARSPDIKTSYTLSALSIRPDTWSPRPFSDFWIHTSLSSI